MPKTFDPARAAAAPETDVANALFEGLTEIDGESLEAKPAVADKWSSSDDQRVWTFYLRKGLRWSNGDRLTAEDFVSSWRRLVSLGDKVAHRELIQNIVGAKGEKAEPPSQVPNAGEHDQLLSHIPVNPAASQLKSEPLAPPRNDPPHEETVPGRKGTKPKEVKFGAEALDDATLQVTLELPDKDFPKLVANPIFFPIYGDGDEFEDDPLDDGVITNGAFKVATVEKDTVLLERSDTYWNRSAVKLERARLISKDSAEAALNAYKAGDLDAVTNADFEPLALKLLSPYEDFRQTVHSALNFYEVNTSRAPFNDRRVREALARAIDRDLIADGQLEGSTQAADRLSPAGGGAVTTLSFDAAKARDLLDKAGYPNGENFPAVRLVVNRNDTQMRIARAIARMWKQNLGVETEIVVKELADIDATRTSGDYDVIRRGIVLPTLDEMAVLKAVFGTSLKEPRTLPTATPHAAPEAKKGGPSVSDEPKPDTEPKSAAEPELMTEDDALYEARAIPLYFPMSYSLVKPYVHGFSMNILGAPSLKYVSVDSNWQPAR